jgi:hypothetical protein
MDTKSLRQPITYARIFESCQFKSDLPKSVQEQEIALLAEDFRKLGIEIPTKDKSGKSLSGTQTCQIIGRVLPPDPSTVCTFNEKGNSDKAVYRLVEFYNKIYGANISLKKKPLDPKSSAYRDVPALCGDLFSVFTKITNNLSSEIGGVKSKLLKQLKFFYDQRMVLGSELDRLMGSITADGSGYDKLKDDLQKLTDLKSTLFSKIDNHQSTLVSELQKYDTAIHGAQAGGGIEADLKELEQTIDEFKQRQKTYGPQSSEVQGSAINVTGKLAHVHNRCAECLERFGTSSKSLMFEDPIQAKGKIDDLRMRLLSIKGTDRKMIDGCHQFLLDSLVTQQCARDELLGVPQTVAIQNGIQELIKGGEVSFKDYSQVVDDLKQSRQIVESLMSEIKGGKVKKGLKKKVGKTKGGSIQDLQTRAQSSEYQNALSLLTK